MADVKTTAPNRKRPGVPGRRPRPSASRPANKPEAADVTPVATKKKAPAKKSGSGKDTKDFKSLPPPSKNMSRRELAEKYTPYVRSIAGKIKKTLSKDIEFDDLVSYGMVGLMEAADRFDAKYGANFMTFAYYRVRGAIYDGLRGMGWVSRTEYQRYRFEQSANAYLNSVADQQMGSVGGIKKSEDDEVTELANAVEGLVTIYVTALDAMEGFQIKDDRGPAVDESLELLQARELVAEAVGKLPEQEKKLLQLYYYKELSLEEVGKHLGLSKSWTSRLHTRAIEKLGRLLKDLVNEYADEKPQRGAQKKTSGRRSAQPSGPASR